MYLHDHEGFQLVYLERAYHLQGYNIESKLAGWLIFSRGVRACGVAAVLAIRFT